MKKVILLILCVFSFSIHAAVTEQIRIVDGIGESYQAALNQALLTALQQVQGSELGIEKQQETSISHIFSRRADLLIEQTHVKNEVFNQSQGRIKSFEVLEIVQPTAQTTFWRVKVQVSVPQYTSSLAANDTRYSLAVMPFIVEQKQLDIADETLSKEQFSQQLREQILSDLSRTGQYALLNRDQQQTLKQEYKLLSSALASVDAASTLGQTQAADFILLGRVQYVGLPKKKRSFYGADFNENRIQAQIAYQVVEVASQRILVADSIQRTYVLDRDFDSIQLVAKLAQQVTDTVNSAISPTFVPVQTEEQKPLLPTKPLTPGSSEKPLQWH